ncbi:MAG: hypothetical protein IAF94_16790, partial [Pirellulaceae bacterium]|nr:hypothetical protein [Pirellulaceae bacterium]
STLNFEWDSRDGAVAGKGLDFVQLVYSWWVAGTIIYWRIDWPKLAAWLTPPRTLFTGYVNQEPIPSVPESNRMMLPTSMKKTSDNTNTDHVAA